MRMIDIVSELAKLVRAQQEYIDHILDEMDRSEGRHYDMLDQHLIKQLKIKDQLLDSLENIIGGSYQ